jgi:hypothetical protein
MTDLRLVQTEASTDESLQWCAVILERLHGIGLEHLEVVDGGPCGDCDLVASRRRRLGRLLLCLGCTAKRVRAGRRAA